MGVYGEVLFPALYDGLMGCSGFDRFRAGALAAARGKVLEVGIGTGRNLEHYPAAATTITGLDPSRGMLRKLQRRLVRQTRRVDAVRAGAEAIPFADDSFDTVVSFLTLCSVPDRARALREIRRVLRPDGQWLVFEHGLSPQPRLARWQRRLSPLQRALAAGCSLDVAVRTELEAADFDCRELEAAALPGISKSVGYVYSGTVRIS
jgi:SAM-dependent methyltransferase